MNVKLSSSPGMGKTQVCITLHKLVVLRGFPFQGTPAPPHQLSVRNMPVLGILRPLKSLAPILLDTSDFAYKRFVNILETIDVVQPIDKPTHNSGHLLDYIITRKDNSSVSNLYVSDFICDHRALHASLTCNRAHPEHKQIEVILLKCIHMLY